MAQAVGPVLFGELSIAESFLCVLLPPLIANGHGQLDKLAKRFCNLQ